MTSHSRLPLPASLAPPRPAAASLAVKTVVNSQLGRLVPWPPAPLDLRVAGLAAADPAARCGGVRSVAGSHR